MTFISYAQNYEDVILWRALRHVERGFLRRCRSSRSRGEFGHACLLRTRLVRYQYRAVGRVFREADAGQTSRHQPKGRWWDEKQDSEPCMLSWNGSIDAGPGNRAGASSSGYMGSEILVPVLTLTKILENWAAADDPFPKDRCRRR